jgi:hypothetical protein
MLTFSVGKAPARLADTLSTTGVVGNSGRRIMTRSKAFALIGITTALGVLDNDSAAAKAGRHSSGAVVPWSLDGINPVYHPAIFGNPAVARSYGFVRGQGGVWRVASDCRRY